ncbi:hypothetical protein TCA2_4552 [Paenibacillus sp. TCA20]|uniref:hypothetical protein n=1 Tax=Paenibacillus sp. TCA20 TaxID=1499968 RepID=UPI0004DA11A7|nr:hypothetical protein [Paenibacillus sp. TCA20]GAK42060.1 hypothetical protein TCA2_4552 [Paenibacillus sp. TCA20]
MAKYNEKDISFYGEGIDGDLIAGQPDTDGLVDLLMTSDYESARQDISNRARTQTGDWRSHPQIGGDLELLEGEPNTRDTANQGVSQLLQTLTYDGRFAAGDVEVRAVPIDIYTIDFFCFVDAGEDTPIVVNQSTNL